MSVGRQSLQRVSRISKEQNQKLAEEIIESQEEVVTDAEMKLEQEENVSVGSELPNYLL
ncbi:hypothetical protein ACTQ6A_03995 [Lachnospiraceae bacterium LCP25S3_G4]